MAVVAIQIKIMPESLDVSLEGLKEKAREKILKLGGMNLTFSEENIAFGLKALIAKFAFPEQSDSSSLETELGNLEGVSSAQITDYRRAFG